MLRFNFNLIKLNFNFFDLFDQDSDSNVLSKENKASVLNDIVRTIVKLLKTFDTFIPPNPTTVCLFKFLLRKYNTSFKLDSA